MNIKDWALVVFTILAQMSVGAFVLQRFVHLYATRKASVEEADRMNDRAVVVIILTLGLGFLASLLHLGSPVTAPKAVLNYATSWLSREILLGVAFVVLGALFALLQWFKIGPAVLRNVIAWIASAFGLGLVYSMAMVYMLPTMPSWNTLATPILFFVTTFLLGALALGVAFVVNYAMVQKKDPGCADAQCQLLRSTMSWIAILAVVLVGIELVVIPINLAFLAVSGPEAQASLGMMIGQFGLAFFLRLLLAFVGAGVLGLFLYQAAQEVGKEKVLSYMAYGAFALVIVAEVMGRYLFYVTTVQIGL
jgi:anaerobic dimethyl sulfoxide reductase subunit C